MKLIEKGIKIFLPLFLFALSLFLAGALWNNCMLYEPNEAIAKAEAISLLIVAFLCLLEFKWEIGKQGIPGC